MPLPKSKPRESKANFMKRCMVDAQARADFPNREQRLAVCNTQFGR